MIGEVFNYAPFKEFYKRELWETVKSLLIIAIIFSVLVIASSVAVAFAGSAASSTSSTSGTQLTNNLGGLYGAVESSYLQPQLQGAETTFGGLLGLSVGTDMLKSLVLFTWFPIPIFTNAGILGAVQSGSQAQIMQSGYIDSLTTGTGSTSIISIAAAYSTIMLISFQFQSDLLYVVAAIGLGVFIPIGIVMRAIPFIRGIGGTMIAIGIGLAIVYPILMIGFNLPVSNYIYAITSPGGTSSTSTCPFSIGLFCTLWSGINSLAGSFVVSGGTALGGVPQTPITNVMQFAFGSSTPSNTALVGQGFWTGLLGPFGFYGHGSGIFPALNFVIDNSINQIVQFILFVLDLIIGIATVSGIAVILGGKLTLGIGKRFKLV